MSCSFKSWSVAVALLGIGVLSEADASEISQTYDWLIDPVYGSPLGTISSGNIHVFDPFNASLGTLTDIRWSVEAGIAHGQFNIPTSSSYPINWSVGAGTICAITFGGLGAYTCDTSAAVTPFFPPQFTASGSNIPGLTETSMIPLPPMGISLNLALSGLVSGVTFTNALDQIGMVGAAAGVGAFAFGNATAQIPDILGGPQELPVEFFSFPFEGTFTWTYVYDAVTGGPGAVPEPATLVLMGLGLVGLWSVGRSKTGSKSSFC